MFIREEALDTLMAHASDVEARYESHAYVMACKDGFKVLTYLTNLIGA